MKSYVFLLLVISCVGAVRFPRLTHRRTARDVCSGTDNECPTDGTSGPMCRNKTHLVYCNSGTLLPVADCGAKFCNPDTYTCSENNPCEAGTATQVNLDCKFRGFFPHPLDCTKFLYCDKGGVVASIYKCPGSSKYDHGKKMCTSASTCKSVTETNGACFNKKNFETVLYPGDPTVYIICSTMVTPLINTCDTPLTKYDVNVKACKFTCPAEGFFQYKEETKYYTCVREGTGLKDYVQTCGNSGKFNPTTNFCESPPPPPSGTRVSSH